MLSSIFVYVRMLDGRDRGHVVEVNREIALPLIESKQAIAIEDVTAKDALEPWDHKRLAEFVQGRASAGAPETSASLDAGEVTLPRAVEVTPRAKAKKR